MIVDNQTEMTRLLNALEGMVKKVDDYFKDKYLYLYDGLDALKIREVHPARSGIVLFVGSIHAAFTLRADGVLINDMGKEITQWWIQ